MREIIKNCGVTQTEMNVPKEIRNIFDNDYHLLKIEQIAWTLKYTNTFEDAKKMGQVL